MPPLPLLFARGRVAAACAVCSLGLLAACSMPKLPALPSLWGGGETVGAAPAALPVEPAALPALASQTVPPPPAANATTSEGPVGGAMLPASTRQLTVGRDVLREIVATPVVFNFDRHEPHQVRPESLRQLDAMIERLREFREATVTEIRLVGHADRLNATGQADYNDKLSAKRVATVRQMLIQRGLNPALLTTAYAGDTQQVEPCDEKKLSRAELQECLLPNRRVEVHVISRR